MTDFAFLESIPREHYNRVDAQTVNAVNIFAQMDKGAAFVTTEYRPRYEAQRPVLEFLLAGRGIMGGNAMATGFPAMEMKHATV